MIILDPEFKALIPPLSAEEYAQLEENIKAEGCRDPLVLWGEILMDGHNRLEICERHGIPYRTVQKDFEDRDEAMLWMIDTQRGRRNLSKVDSILLAQKKASIWHKQTREKVAETTRQSNKQRANPSFIQMDKTEPAIHAQEEIARDAGVSTGTVARFEQVQKIKPELIENIRSGEMSINQAYQEVKQPHVAYNSGNNEWYTPADIIEAARKIMGGIDLDPASSVKANEVVKAAEIYTADINGLKQEWYGNVWMNPPYSSELIEQFVDKLLQELPHIEQAMVLVNNATETAWFSKLAHSANMMCFPRGRVKFYTPDGKTGAPLQGQAIMYYGNHKQEFAKAFKESGIVCLPVE